MFMVIICSCRGQHYVQCRIVVYETSQAINQVHVRVSEIYPWTKQFGFITKSRKSDFRAFCTLCSCNVHISGMGKIAVERHAVTDKHKVNTRRGIMSSLLSFSSPDRSSQDDTMMVGELCIVYHAVKHHLSYTNTDWSKRWQRHA